MNVNSGIEIEFEGFRIRYWAKQPKYTEKGRKAFKKKSLEKLIKSVKSSGEWWKLWEHEDRRKWLERTISHEILQYALTELKNVYTANWFKTCSDDHKIKQKILSTDPPFAHFFVTFGLAIKELGGVSTLRRNRNIIKDLRNSQNCVSRGYELIVLAFLKRKYRKVLLEHELGLGKKKKPDAKVEGLGYVEVRKLRMSDKEKEAHETIERLQNIIHEQFKHLKGFVGCSVDLGNPSKIDDLRRRIEIAEALIKSIELKDQQEKELITSEGSVKVHVKYMPASIKVMYTPITNYGALDLWERMRVAQILIEESQQNPGDEPLIVIIDPSVPLDLTAPMEVAKEIFEYAVQSEESVLSVRELWIDVTVGYLKIDSISSATSANTKINYSR